MNLLLIRRSSQVAERLDSIVTDDSRAVDGSILGFYRGKSSLPFLEQARKPQQNPDERTCVTVSLRVVSTCWPWPSCCPTRIAALLWVDNLVAWCGLEMLRHDPGQDQLLSNVYVESSLACSKPVRACWNYKKAQEGIKWRFLFGNPAQFQTLALNILKHP